MFHFANSPPWFARCGLALLCLPFILFIFGMPPFKAGLWSHTEPALVAAFLISAANGLWLLLGIRKKWLGWQHPKVIFLCLAAWVAWQLVITVFASSPWRSWFGPGEIGEGAGWHASIFLLFMTAYPLWQEAAYRKAILAIAATVIMTLCTLHTIAPDDLYPLSPLRWPDYLAFMAAQFWVACIVGIAMTWQRYALLVLFMAATLFVSSNISAMLFIGIAIVFTTLVTRTRLPRLLSRLLCPGRGWKMTAAILCLLPMLLIPLSNPIIKFAAEIRNPAAENSELDWEESLGSRLVLNEIAKDTFKYEPGRLLIGNGWGNLPHDLFRHLLIDGMLIFQDGMRKPNWTIVNGTSFHSHSQPLEALLSLGLPGILLWFAFPIVGIWTVPRRLFWHLTPVIVALVASSCIWFQPPQTMAYQALLLVALCAAGRGRRVRVACRPRYATTFLAVLTGMMMLSAWLQWGAVKYSEEVFPASIEVPYRDRSEQWVMSDTARGGYRLYVSARAYTKWLSDYIYSMYQNGQKPDEDNAFGWYTYFMNAALEAETHPTSDALTASLYLWLQYELLLNLGPPPPDLKARVLRDMPRSVLRMAVIAPQRDDFAAYFLYNIEAIIPNARKRLALLNRLLEFSPDHRGALWVKGQILLTLPGQEEAGKALLRHAAQLGVERVYPVSNEELAPWKD